MSDEPKKNADTSDAAQVVHVYDEDLVEEDNRLPLWWQYTLYGAIGFASFYWYGEHELGAWASQGDSYQQEMITVRLEQARKGGGALPAETLIAMSKSPATVEQGKQVFVSICAQCHRADGGGNIGPNLTDEYWLHGSKPQNIWATVHDGVPQKGMPTWGLQIGDERVAAVVAYVLTIKGTNVPGGKPPQGEKEQ